MVAKVREGHTDSVELPKIVGVTTEVFVKGDFLSARLVEDGASTCRSRIGDGGPIRENTVILRAHRVDQGDSSVLEILFPGSREVVGRRGRVGKEVTLKFSSS